MNDEKETKKQALIAKETQKLENEGRELRRKQQVVADLKRERTMSIAHGEGIKWGALASTVVGAGTYGLSRYKVEISKHLSASAKISLPIMAGLFAFALNVELKMHDVHRFPEKYGIHGSKEDEDAYNTNLAKANNGLKIPFQVPVHHRMLNFVYDRPFYLVTGLSVPVAAYIFNEQVKLTGYKFSQRVMHSRIFAQGSVIGILVITMIIRDYMEKRGKFPETHEEMELYSKFGRVN